MRIYPDQIHVDLHEPALSEDERRWGQHYQEQIGRAGQDEGAARLAWQQLADRFDPQRAAWIARVLRATPGQPGTTARRPRTRRAEAGSGRPSPGPSRNAGSPWPRPAGPSSRTPSAPPWTASRRWAPTRRTRPSRRRTSPPWTPGCAGWWTSPRPRRGAWPCACGCPRRWPSRGSTRWWCSASPRSIPAPGRKRWPRCWTPTTTRTGWASCAPGRPPTTAPSNPPAGRRGTRFTPAASPWSAGPRTSLPEATPTSSGAPSASAPPPPAPRCAPCTTPRCGSRWTRSRWPRRCGRRPGATTC